MLVLEAYDIDAGGVDVQEQGFRESFPRLATQTVDGLFFLAGQPSDIVSRAAGKYARIMPLSGAPIDRLRERYPFFRPSLIPSRTYSGQELPVKTLGLESLLLCRSGLEARHVRQVTKAWFTTLERVGHSGLIANAIGPKAAAATPIPLHPGAADYYRARQLLPE
jgi:TRAP transporter TAXI family solute receptor